MCCTSHQGKIYSDLIYGGPEKTYGPYSFIPSFESGARQYHFRSGRCLLMVLNVYACSMPDSNDTKYCSHVYWSNNHSEISHCKNVIYTSWAIG